MTENKRFEICGEGSTNIDVTTYIVEYGDGDDDCFELYESKEDSQKVCDKINNILDENEQLKQSYKEFEDECQSTFNAMSRKQNDLYRKNFKLKEENEHIKNTIKEAYDNERTQIGKNTLKQLMEAIQ